MADPSLRMCRYAEDPARFLDLLARIGCPFADATSFPLAARYYETYFGESYGGDLSFIIYDGDAPLGLVRAQAIGETVSDNGQSLVPFTISDRVSEAALIEHLENIAQTVRARIIKVIESNRSGNLGALGRNLLNRRAAPTVRLQAIADLSRDESVLKGGIRKSYRSLVNWGLRTLRFEFVTASTFDIAAFEAFHAFHIRISGRETRSRASWDIQAEMIRAGRADLILSYLDGHGLVSGSLMLDTGVTTTYGVGVYERSLFDKPLAHAPLYSAMLRAKERGQRCFVIGDVPPAKSHHDKEFTIGQFKSGFTADLHVDIEWSLAVSPAAAE